MKMVCKKADTYGGYHWTVILDDSQPGANWISKTHNCVLNTDSFEFFCLKCLTSINWIDWPTKNRARGTCSCGEEVTLTIINMDVQAERR